MNEVIQFVEENWEDFIEFIQLNYLTYDGKSPTETAIQIVDELKRENGI